MITTVVNTIRVRTASRLTDRTTRRRLTEVAAEPALASLADIELLIRAHGVPEQKVWTVCDRLAAGSFEPSTVWNWVMEFDGTELADLVADVDDDGDLAEILEGRPRMYLALVS